MDPRQSAPIICRLAALPFVLLFVLDIGKFILSLNFRKANLIEELFSGDWQPNAAQSRFLRGIVLAGMMCFLIVIVIPAIVDLYWLDPWFSWLTF